MLMDGSPAERSMNEVKYYFGAHLSMAAGYARAVEAAVAIGANTFQFFTRNPRGSRSKVADPEDLKQARQLAAENGFGPLVGHAPYIVNLASPEERTWHLALQVMEEDLARAEQLDCPYLVVHPGSHVGTGIAAGIRRVSTALDRILVAGGTTMVLLETMAGMGSEVGSTFEELAEIMEGCAYPERVGVCLDTCHIHAAGYAVREGFGETLDRFERIIGLDRCKAIHLNDSRFPAGEHKDRHANLGEGTIGKEGISGILGDRRLAGRPFILETPGGPDTYREEIAFLHRLTDIPAAGV